MVLWAIVIGLLLLIFAVPYGVDASYEEAVLRLSIKAGPFRIRVLPARPVSEKKAERKRRRAEKRRAQKEARAQRKAAGPIHETETVKPKKPLDIPFILALVKMLLRAIKRVFRSFRIDRLKLHYVVATSDPYDTATQYSWLCGALAALPEIAGDVIRIRKKDIQLGMDFTSEKPAMSVRIVISLQLYKLVCVAAAFAVEYIRWKRTHRKPAAETTERMNDNGREQDQ